MECCHIELLAEELICKKANVVKYLKKHFAMNKDYTENKTTYEKASLEKQHGGQNRSVFCLNKDVYDLIKHTFNLRQNKNIEILKKGDIEIKYVNRVMNLERSTVGFLYNILSPSFKCFQQFKVLQYRIDLYFSEKNLAIECDEMGHLDRDIYYEVTRQTEIEKELSCTFVRFNPNDPKFCIEKFTAKIIKIITSN